MSKRADLEMWLDSTNEAVLRDLYERYLKDPAAVDSNWHPIFQELGDDLAGLLADGTAPSFPKTSAPQHVTQENVIQEIQGSLRALMMIRAYRVRGHLHARLDPLNLVERPHHSELDPKSYGFTEADEERHFYIDGVLGLESPTLREIINVLHKTYCGTIGVEFMHIQDAVQKSWIQERIERRARDFLSADEKRHVFESIARAETFEKFLNTKFVGAKRFGLDGGEAVIPAMTEILADSATQGVQEVVIGMAHRGRLNVLTNILGKPFEAIFAEFLGKTPLATPSFSGDVKYHQGFSVNRTFGGKDIHLSLTPNPSHLEAVDPVVLGRVRAKQELRDKDAVLGILMHGDAAFAGQGVIPECFELSQLQGYRTGGTVHIVVNNQIGFTTSPTAARSSPYCSDVAKVVQAPIFHVNGDDPEAVVYVARLASQFRREFKQDVVLDIYCYRRYGHNEGDEPSFTQPKMYSVIGQKPSVLQIYAEALVRDGVLSAEQSAQEIQECKDVLTQAFENVDSYKNDAPEWLQRDWAGMTPGDMHENPETGLDLKVLKEIGLALATTPSSLNVHPKIVRQLENKKKMMETGQGIDWAMAEALAFGTLLREGYPVRLSGQDCRRGTFSQRHAVLVDQETEEDYIPLNHLASKQAPFTVVNSPLAEMSVLGYEYGYSQATPRALVIWEAQFGDFSNGAQVIIDQFVASGESKWSRMSGVVLMLPHGYEGQGPEHSSARVERYLQLCAEDNMIVANCTTPANLFHILRRQQRRSFRKPLVLFTPKSLLRHPLAVSTLQEMEHKTTFQPVLREVDSEIIPAHVRRVVLCSGKVYYDLLDARRTQKIVDVALVRVEEIHPFPHAMLLNILAPYATAEVVWCQEEPENMGAWTFIDRRLEEVMTELKMVGGRPRYVGRRAAASPATGYLARHVQEQQTLIEQALKV